MKNLAPMGPFGPKRLLNLQTASTKKIQTLWASGYLARQKAGGPWVLTKRGETLFYVA